MKNNIAIYLTGFGIGIFLGLSKSPILLQVLVPILTILVGLLSILTGQKGIESQKEHSDILSRLGKINAFPIMFLVFGMVTGVVPGMLARNYQVLTPKELRYTERKIIDSLLAKVKSADQLENVISTTGTILHNSTSDACIDLNLCKLFGIELIGEISKTKNPSLRSIINSDTLVIEEIEKQTSILCNCKN